MGRSKRRIGKGYLAFIILALIAMTAYGQSVDQGIIPTELTKQKMLELYNSAISIAKEEGLSGSAFGLEAAIWPYVKKQATFDVWFMFFDKNWGVHSITWNNYAKSIYSQGKTFEWYGGGCAGKDALVEASNSVNYCLELIEYVYRIFLQRNKGRSYDQLSFNYRLTLTPESDCQWEVEMGISAERSLKYRINQKGEIAEIVKK
jgi:hypothetical protein